MARYERFTFLVDPNERQAIAALAERLSRSQSDAVRFVVIEAAKQLTADSTKQTNTYSAGKSKGEAAHAVTA